MILTTLDSVPELWNPRHVIMACGKEGVVPRSSILSCSQVLLPMFLPCQNMIPLTVQYKDWAPVPSYCVDRPEREDKFLAKLASVEAKPIPRPDRIDPGLGVKVVEPGTEQAFLDPLKVQRLWGVGPATLDKLHRLGVTVVSDLHRVDRSALGAALGKNQANHLLALAIGADDRAVEPDRDAKSIGHEETYARNVHIVSEMRTNLVRLSDAVATRFRKAGVGARTLTLKVRFDDGLHTITRSTTGREAIDSA